MILFKRVKIRSYEVGLHFRDGEFKGLLSAGRHWLFDPLWKVQVDVVSQRAPWLVHDKLDVIVKSGALAGRAEVVDLKDYQRALVWIDGRFSHVLPPGLYAYWTGAKDVRVNDSSLRRKARSDNYDRMLSRMEWRCAETAVGLDLRLKDAVAEIRLVAPNDPTFGDRLPLRYEARSGGYTLTVTRSPTRYETNCTPTLAAWRTPDRAPRVPIE